MTVGAWFTPHNGEHRILATRLWEVFWFQAAGEWDPQLVMTANAAVFAAMSALIACGMASGLTGRARWWVLVFVAAALAIPFSYSNLLWGFQSQFYFLLLATAGALTCAYGPRRGWQMIGGSAFCCGLALLSVGAGAITGAALFTVGLWCLVTKRSSFATVAPYLAIGAATVVAGLLLRVSAAPSAGSVSAAQSFAQALAWPNSNLLSLVAKATENPAYMPRAIVNFPSEQHSFLRWISAQLNGGGVLLGILYGLLALIAWWPLALFAASPRSDDSAGGRFTFAMGIWSGGIAASIGLARGNEVFVGTRFVDCLEIGLIASGVCLLRLWPRWPKRGMRRLLTIAWEIVVLGGLAATALGIFGQQLPRKAAEGRSWTRHVQAYLAAGDPETLEHAQINELPILGSDPALLRTALDRPEVRAILPRQVQPNPVVPGGLSQAARLLRMSGIFWLMLGAVLLWLDRSSERNEEITSRVPETV